MYGEIPPPPPTPRVCNHLVDKTLTFVVKRHLYKSRRDKARMNEKAVFFTAVITVLISSNKLFQGSQLDDEKRSRYVINIPGAALTDHLISTHDVKSSITCGQLCLSNKQCRSFNFGTIPRGTKFLCELSSSDAKRSPMNLKKQGEFVYFAFLQVGLSLEKIKNASP